MHKVACRVCTAETLPYRISSALPEIDACNAKIFCTSFFLFLAQILSCMRERARMWIRALPTLYQMYNVLRRAAMRCDACILIVSERIGLCCAALRCNAFCCDTMLCAARRFLCPSPCAAAFVYRAHMPSHSMSAPPTLCRVESAVTTHCTDESALLTLCCIESSLPTLLCPSLYRHCSFLSTLNNSNQVDAWMVLANGIARRASNEVDATAAIA